MTHLEIKLLIITKELRDYLQPKTPKWVIPLFFHWLRKEKCLLNYLNNFDGKFLMTVAWLQIPPHEFIEDAFEWRKTNEGDEFWTNLSEKWKKHWNTQLKLLKS